MGLGVELPMGARLVFNEKCFVKFPVITVVTALSIISWDMTPYRLHGVAIQGTGV
jgi:hypothetical protein